MGREAVESAYVTGRIWSYDGMCEMSRILLDTGAAGRVIWIRPSAVWKAGISVNQVDGKKIAIFDLTIQGVTRKVCAQVEDVDDDEWYSMILGMPGLRDFEIDVQSSVQPATATIKRDVYRWETRYEGETEVTELKLDAPGTTPSTKSYSKYNKPCKYLLKLMGDDGFTSFDLDMPDTAVRAPNGEWSDEWDLAIDKFLGGQVSAAERTTMQVFFDLWQEFETAAVMPQLVLDKDPWIWERMLDKAYHLDSFGRKCFIASMMRVFD